MKLSNCVPTVPVETGEFWVWGQFEKHSKKWSLIEEEEGSGEREEGGEVKEKKGWGRGGKYMKQTLIETEWEAVVIAEVTAVNSKRWVHWARWSGVTSWVLVIMWACHFSRFGQVVIYDKSAHTLYLNLIFQKLTITCGSSPVNSHKGEAQFGGAVITPSL